MIKKVILTAISIKVANMVIERISTKKDRKLDVKKSIIEEALLDGKSLGGVKINL
jgi:hypothetical protein